MADEIVTLLKYSDYPDKKVCCFCEAENISTASKCYLCGADLTKSVIKEKPPKKTTVPPTSTAGPKEKPDDVPIFKDRDGEEKIPTTEEPKNKTLLWIVATIVVSIIIFAILGYNYIVVPNNILVSSGQEALMYNGTLLYTVSSYDERIYNVLNECDIYADVLLDSSTYDDYQAEGMYIRQYTIKTDVEISEVILSGKNTSTTCEIDRLDKIGNAQIQDNYYNILNKANSKNITYDVHDVSLNFENKKWKIIEQENGFFRISKFNDENTALSCSGGGLSNGEVLAKEYLTVATKKNDNSQLWKFVKSSDGYYIVSAKNEDMFLSCDSSGEVYLASWEFVDENYLWTLGKIEGYERYVEYEWKQSYPYSNGWQSAVFKEEQKNCIKLFFDFRYAETDNGYSYPFGRTATVILKNDGKWKEFKTFTTPSKMDESKTVEIEFEELTNISEIHIVIDAYEQSYYSYGVYGLTAKVI